MDRISIVRALVIDKLKNEAVSEDSLQAAYSHLYGVSYMAALIAAKRGLNIELVTIAGMLHDLASFVIKGITGTIHAKKSAELASELLSETAIFASEEISIIAQTIENHGYKEQIDTPTDEVLKDADVFAHGLFNVPNKNFRTYRWKDLCDEFNIVV